MSHHVAFQDHMGQDPTVDTEPALKPGDWIADRYQVIAPLGRGGTSTTYLVHDIVDGSKLSLKLLHSDQTAMVEALQFEFRTLQSIHHPNLCPVHDFGFLHPSPHQNQIPTHGISCFYTAEAIDGITLEKHALQHPWDTTLPPLLHALEALRLLHRLGVRHGDFKPGNILVRRNGSGVLVDLGCARPLDMAPASHVSGTRAFMAPELTQGKASDARADLFAVGVTLQKLAARTDPRPPRSHSQLAKRLTNPNPNHRPNSVDEVLEALGASPCPIAPASTWRGHFVGRETYLATAQRAVDGLLANSPGSRVMIVTGPPGVGRTRLLQEIEWQAQPRCRVLRAGSNTTFPVEDMLARALRHPVAPGHLPIIEALQELILANNPIVLLFDNAQRLDTPHRERLTTLARLIEPNSPILLILTTTPEITFDIEDAEELTLAPLTSHDLGNWLGPTFGSESIEAFFRLTGGYPDAVKSLIGQLRAGQHKSHDASCPKQELDLHEDWAHRFQELPIEQHRVIGLLALAGGNMSSNTALELTIEGDHLEALRSCGFIDRDGTGWRLTRGAEGEAFLEKLPENQKHRLHAEVATWLKRKGDAVYRNDPWALADHNARLAHHLALAHHFDKTLALVRKNIHQLERAPNTWLHTMTAVLKTLERHLQPTDLLLATARLERLAGRITDALHRLDDLAGCQQPSTLLAPIEAERAACHAALGQNDLAEEILQEAMGKCESTQDRGVIATQLARTQLRKGSYAMARRTAKLLGEMDLTTAERAEALSIEGMANSYLGNGKVARLCLVESIRTLSSADRPEAHVRTLTSLALHDLREGNLEASQQGLGQALRIAKDQNLAHAIANLCLNLGVVYHQRGDWPTAIEIYEKGLLVAKALGTKATEASLLCNLAKVHADIGAFQRAKQRAELGRDIAFRRSLPLTVAAADAVLAEIASAQGNPKEAFSRLLPARAAFLSSGSKDEVIEIDLQLIETAAQQGDLNQAHRFMDACQEAVGKGESSYLSARFALLKARLLYLEGKFGEGIVFAEKAVNGFADHRDAEAEARLLLSELATSQGAPHLAQQHLSVARALWERTIATLSAAEREIFWQHPKRSRAQEKDAESIPSSSVREEAPYRRLLDINKRLNSSLRTEDVLRAAMDAAIELTGAERGFVLLQNAEKRGSLSVAVARNVDREQVGRSHLKFSRSIARRVLREGQPVLSTDAVGDRRFRDEASVHAMHLASVACVPIHSPEGVLGALYLDNRFQRGRFSDRDVELLLAFADQVAIALRNARLLDTLQRQNEDLEKERRRVQELAEGQAAEIERLNDQVRITNQSMVRRYDYSHIVGGSRAMQQVFDVLDRVTDTSASVLIRGESGTGKELIARALHHNGPRQGAHLVSVNCAALPEPLLESELFGHVRGAFTGADRDREGLILRADGGTLFLDEVADLPLSTQVKLLRVLQEREVLPVGSSHPQPVDFRLVCATNQSLRHAITAGTFREDLYYRIAVVRIEIPALRNRTEDIPALVMVILQRLTESSHKPSPTISNEAMRKLLRYPWPGNVRQLENVLTRAFLLSDNTQIQPSDIDLPPAPTSTTIQPSRERFEKSEREQILQALEANRWNVRKVAPLLGLPRSTLYRKLKRHGIAVRKRGKP